jgi:hypothetical protein
MEWKEHVGWLAPIAATVVAFAVTYYFVVSFATAAIAGMFGAFINKVAPIR